MSKKKKKDPDQGDLFERPMTSEECKEAGGDSWKADPETLGKSEDGKNKGWCKKKQGWF